MDTRTGSVSYENFEPRAFEPTVVEGLDDSSSQNLQQLTKQLGMSEEESTRLQNQYASVPPTTTPPPKSTGASMASIRQSLGIDKNKDNTKQFASTLAQLMKESALTFKIIKKNLMDILTKRKAYDPAEYIASRVAGVVAGRTKLNGDSIKAYFKGAGTELNHVFTHAHLDAINTENPPRSVEEQVVHDVLYDYMLFPLMMWAVYNWYYKLFYPMAKCPEMKNYSDWYSMVFPGIITGPMVLPLYEMDKGMFFVNQMFSEKTKYDYGYVFFTGCFLAVYFLWIKGAADFSYPKFMTLVTAWSVINVLFLMFGDYMMKYPVMSLASALVFFFIMMVAISLSFVFADIVYILVMIYFIYYSFFVLPVENDSWDIFELLEKVNQANIKDTKPDDSFWGRLLKHINNYIFTSPVLIVLCFMTMCEISDVSSHLPNGSWLKMSMSVMLVCVFIMSAFYSVFEFYLAFFQKKLVSTDAIPLDNYVGLSPEDMSHEIYNALKRAELENADVGKTFKKLLPAVAMLVVVIVILIIIMTISQGLKRAKPAN